MKSNLSNFGEIRESIKNGIYGSGIYDELNALTTEDLENNYVKESLKELFHNYPNYFSRHFEECIKFGDCIYTATFVRIAKAAYEGELPKEMMTLINSNSEDMIDMFDTSFKQIENIETEIKYTDDYKNITRLNKQKEVIESAITEIAESGLEIEVIEDNGVYEQNKPAIEGASDEEIFNDILE